MTLRCRPGDLAIIVKAGSRARHAIGRVVCVTRISEDLHGDPAWEYEPPLIEYRPALTFATHVLVLNDSCLVPLRGELDEQSIPADMRVEA